MAQTIDKLQVEIEASAKGVSQVFTQIQNQLKTIQSVMKSINTSNLTKLSKATNVSVNTSGVTKAQRDISNSVSKIQQSLSGLESYKNAALSGDSSSLTSFNRRVISIQSSIDTLKTKMQQLGITQIESPAFTSLKTQSDALETKLTSLQTQMNDVLSGNTTMSSTAFSQLTDDIKNTSAELQSVESQMQNMTLDGTAYVNADSLSTQLDSAKSEVDAFVSDVNSQKPSLDTSGITISLSDVISNAKTAASKLLELSSSAIKSGFSAISSSLSKIKNTLTSIGSSASKSTSTGFSKILKYGFGIRSMYVLFRRLRSAIKDAFTELQTSGAFFETTNANVDALSNSLSTLKYQFGAAFEPIFNYVAPALQTLINYLVSVMNTISAFIAKLTGASTYSKAVVATSEIADNTGSAASSAEDLNKQLQGFDELNNLSGDDDSGSGGSGSSSSDDSTITYVEESVDSVLTSFWDSLYDAISSGDWWKVGSLISEELTSALNSINWDTIFQTASNFGSNLASFLNGLISDDLFSALGTTIANSIKTALYAALSFSENFSWTGLGNAIASGINAIMDAEPLSLAVDTANSWINGILDSLIAAVSGVSWSTLSTHIAEAIGNVDASGFGERLGTLANNIANALYTLVSNKETWTNLGTKIGEGINNFFSSMSAVDSKTGLSGWAALGQTISDTFTGIGTAIITALDEVDWVEVGRSIAEFISNIEWEDVWFTFTALLDAVKTAIINILDGAEISGSEIGMAIGIATLTISSVGMIKTLAGLALPALSSLQLKVAALGLIILSASIASIDLGDLSTNALADAGAGVGFYIAGRMLGWKVSTSLTLAIGAFAVSFLMDTDLGHEIYLKIKNKLGLLNKQGYTVEDNMSESQLKLVKSGEVELDFKKFSIKDSSSESNTAPLVSKVQNFIDKAMAQVNNESVLDVGSNVIKGVEEGANDEASKSGTFKQTVTSVWDKITGWFADIFDMHSPSQAMKPYGQNIILGVIEGFKEKISSFSTTISTLKSNIVTWIQQKFSGFKITDYLSGWGDVTATVSAKLGTPISTIKSWGTSFVQNITNKWTDITSTVEAVLGGDLEHGGIGVLSNWSSYIETLKSHWTGKSATFKSSVGGQITKITDLSSWQTTVSNLKSAWTDKAASFKASVGGQISKYTDLDSWKTKISNLTGAWFSKSATFAASLSSGTTTQKIDDWKSKISGLTGAWFGKSATFAASLANGTTTEKLGSYKSAIDALTSSWKSPESRAYFQADFDESLSTLQNFAEAIKTIYDNWKGRSATFTLSASVDGGDIDELATTLTNKIKNKLSGTVNMNFKAAAMGGILTSGGWKSIPQYASGSLNTGSLFFAGEKSGNPELVGHVNGRTEVLNKSQLASVMYASVGQAMRNFGSLASPPTLTANGYSASGVSGAKGVSNSDALMMEQNRLLERQNMLLEQIANKDNTVSVSDIFGAMQSANNDYYNRTGNSAFVF